MIRIGRLPCILSAVVLALVVGTPRLAVAQDETEPVAPTAQSPDKVTELLGLLEAKELTAFAMEDPDGEKRFVAVLLIPNVQLMVVSAAYERSTDIEYWIYQKDYMSAYQTLGAGMLATEKFFVEDTLADGLALMPDEGTAGDSATVGDAVQRFDGEFTRWDRRKRDDDPIGQVDYYKGFADADQRYTRLLTLLVAELGKTEGGLVRPARLR